MLIRENRALCCTGYSSFQPPSEAGRIFNAPRIRPLVPKLLYKGSGHRHVQGLHVNSRWRICQCIHHSHYAHRPKLPPYSCVWGSDRLLVDPGQRSEEVVRLFPEPVPPPPRLLPPSLCGRPRLGPSTRSRCKTLMDGVARWIPIKLGMHNYLIHSERMFTSQW